MGENCKLVFNLGADAASVKKYPGQKIVYIGSHGDQGAKDADIVLPSAAYTEKNASYTNTEGRAQQTRPAVHPPGAARVDWQIIRALSEVFSEIADVRATLPYDDLLEIRDRMDNYNPVVTNYDVCNGAKFIPEVDVNSASGKVEGKIGVKLHSFKDYFMTCAISRASQNMANCVKSANDMDSNQQYVEPSLELTGAN